MKQISPQRHRDTEETKEIAIGKSGRKRREAKLNQEVRRSGGGKPKWILFSDLS
jgi:hypothetical protein